MLRVCRLALRSRPGKGDRGRRGPKFLDSLSSPAVRAPWGRLGQLSPEDRREVAAGDWRTALPVLLVPDAGDGRPGPGSSGIGSTTAAAATAAVPMADGPVAFASDEAAQSYLDDEAADERLEAGVPSLALAQGFFEALAAAADEEIDAEGAGLQPPAPQSDEDRRREERGLNRSFFLDYYTQQGVVGDGAVARGELLAEMLTPATALFQLNPTRVLCRLTARDQLECDTSGAFCPTVDPLVFSVPAAAVSVPLDRGQGVPLALEPWEGGEEQGEGEGGTLGARESPPLLETAELLELMMADEADTAPAVIEAAPPPPPPPPVVRPLSIGQLHWLQRLVASDTIAEVNLLSPIVSLLAVRLAAPVADPSSSSTATMGRRPRIVYDPFALSQPGGPVSAVYVSDVARLAAATAEVEAAAEEGLDGEPGARASAVADVVVVAALPPPSGQQGHRRDNKDGDGDDLSPSSPAAALPIADQAANTMFLVLPPPAKGSRRHNQPWCAQLLGVCDVVVCCPATTEDGRRPRVTLDGSDEGEEGGPAPNQFITLCGEAGSGYECLKRDLRSAVRHARGNGGWVLYATQTLNPVENEAVVCAVAAEARGTHPLRFVSPASAAVLRGLLPEERAALVGWLSHGAVGGGLRSWAALEAAPADQEAAFHDPALVAEMASAAWRAIPARGGYDGCWLCLMRVGAEGAEGVEAEAGGTVSGSGVGLLDGAAHAHLWGSPVCALGTPAVAAVAARIARLAAGHRWPWRVACAGLPVGHRTPQGSLVLSAAASGTAAVADWLRAQPTGEEAAGGMGATVAPLRVSAVMLSELLLRRRVTAADLHDRLFLLSQRPRLDVAAAVQAAEARLLLASVQALSEGDGGAPRGECNLVLRPFVPAHAVAGGSEEERADGVAAAAMHSAVEQELDSVCVLARLRWSPPTSGTAARRRRHPTPTVASSSPSQDFTISLESLPVHFAERPSHEAAVAEMCVALRDSLAYVLRRVGCPVDRLDLSAGNDEADREAFDDHEEGEGEAGARWGSPDGGFPIPMDEDDYTVEGTGTGTGTGVDLLSRGERDRRGRGLRRMERGMAAEGVPVPGAAASVSDWDVVMPASRRRRAAAAVGRRDRHRVITK